MRRRHYHDSLLRSETSSASQRWRVVAAVLITGSVVLGCIVLLMRVLPFGGSMRSVGLLVRLENTAQTVNIAIDGSDPIRAEDGLRLYAGDTMTTGPNANAGLQFFDGTVIRLAENTQLLVQDSRLGERTSQLRVEIQNGGVWVRTPSSGTFSGAVVRLISSPDVEVELEPGTETVIGAENLTVFSSEGDGASGTISETGRTVVVGEGQTLWIAGAKVGDPYAARRPISAEDVTDFVRDSRSSHIASITPPATPAVPVGEEGAVLTITEPAPQSVVVGSTLTVSGTAGSKVARVQINGYEAPLRSGEYALELALPAENEITITVVAFGEDGARLTEERRTVVRDRTPPSPPHFVLPAKDGETYRTQQTRFEITGEAPANAASIIVNDYKLQFFRPGDRSWRYLADTTLENLKEGENIFTAVAVYEGGDRSNPVTMTIILGEGTEGTVSTGTGASASSAPETQTGMPQNDPLQPGTLLITAPTTGNEFTTAEEEILIEGTPPDGTHSMWVNDYRLRLFDPGETLWNYIASANLGTLKPDRNSYEIIARGEDQRILDRVTYVIVYEPRE